MLGTSKIVTGFLLTFMLSCSPQKDFLVTISTNLGDIKLILFDDTPLHKENFLQLASNGRYDSTSFYRVIEGFMIQGGDVNQKEGTRPNPDNMIPAEIRDHHFHQKGAVAAARNNNPEKKSSENQFYIVHGTVFTPEQLTLDRLKLNQHFTRLLSMPEYADLREKVISLQQAQDIEGLDSISLQAKVLIEKEFEVELDKEISREQLEQYTSVGGAPHLDGEYTVFGQVVDGLEVVDQIATQPTAGERPLNEVIMKVTVEEMSRKKITESFGYQYPDEP